MCDRILVTVIEKVYRYNQCVYDQSLCDCDDIPRFPVHEEFEEVDEIHSGEVDELVRKEDPILIQVLFRKLHESLLLPENRIETSHIRDIFPFPENRRHGFSDIPESSPDIQIGLLDARDLEDELRIDDFRLGNHNNGTEDEIRDEDEHDEGKDVPVIRDDQDDDDDRSDSGDLLPIEIQGKPILRRNERSYEGDIRDDVEHLLRFGQSLII